MAGVIAVVALSFCLSLMFPTIYGVALKGLGPATKFGAAGLVMAIVGGAIMPLVQGKLVDATSAAFSFIVPAGCFAVVGLYALYDLRAEPSVTGGEPARDAGRRARRPRGPPRVRREPAGASRSRPSRRSRWRRARAAATRRRAPRRARSSSRSCRGGPPGPRRRPWTPSSPRSAQSNPGVDAVNGAVAGGAGSNAIVELAKRLQARRPARRLADVRRQVGPGLREPRRGPQRRVGLRQRGSAREDEPHDPPVAHARRPAVRGPDRRASQQRPVVQQEAARARPASRPRRAATPSPRSSPTSRRSRPPARRRCASAPRTGSPRSSCSRTRC